MTFISENQIYDISCTIVTHFGTTVKQTFRISDFKESCSFNKRSLTNWIKNDPFQSDKIISDHKCSISNYLFVCTVV